jgi:membrane-associated phospholipid phosphatase
MIDAPEPPTQPYNWARLVSDVVSPPVVAGLLAIALAIRDGRDSMERLLLSLFILVVALLAPLVYIFNRVQRGKVEDIHMPNRHERYKPLAFSLICNIIVWVGVRLWGPFPNLYLLTTFMLIMTALGLAVTFFWQISVHTTTITGVTILTGMIYGLVPAVLVALFIPVVMAARLSLKRHTPAQTLAGIALGGTIPFIIQALAARL